MYERYGKRLLDIILSLAATIILAIPMGLVALGSSSTPLGRSFSSSAASARAKRTLTS